MLKAILEISMTLFLILMLILMLVGVIGITITAFSERDEDEGDEEKMNGWYWVKTMILDIANKLSYMEELAIVISKTEITNSKDKMLCKKWIIDAHYDLNHQLVMYMDDVLMRMGINHTSKSIYYDFYRYAFDSANEIKEAMFCYLDTGGTESVNIHNCLNDELLNIIIREIDRYIKNEIVKEVK